MNYYKRHLGDYAKNTRTLSTYEHGVYNLILDLYYTDERPVSSEDAYAICRISGAKERAVVNRVLVKFFKLDGDVWRHERADEEIAKYHEKSEKNKAIGSLGGKRKAKRNASETLSESVGERLANDVANDTPSHKPLAISQEEISNPKGLDVETVVSPKADCPITKIVELYHAKLPELPAIEKLTDARKGYLRQRWREDLTTLDHWSNYFDFVRRSKFLMGGALGRDGKPPFRADIEFLTKPASYAKIAEEKYHR